MDEDARRASTVSEQRGIAPNSPATSSPLVLSSAAITAGDTEPDCLWQLELSISVQVLGGFEILLATTKSAGEVPVAQRRELAVNPMLLSSLPGVIHLSGPHHDDAAARSYTLTLTFSAASASAQSWTTTFEVPRPPFKEPTWHLTLPFNHRISGETE